MLKRLIVFYKDGRKEDNIIFVDGNSPTTIYPKADGIRDAFLTPFKYKVKLKPGEAVAIVRLPNKTILMPKGKEIHPKTTLDDVEIINVKKRVEKPQEQIYKIESSSTGSMYMVREVAGRYTCNCTGFFRVKDKSKGCKHIQDIKSQKS
jgi:hypothetical protein